MGMSIFWAHDLSKLLNLSGLYALNFFKHFGTKCLKVRQEKLLKNYIKSLCVKLF